MIVGVQATPARLSQESVAARDMIDRYRERYGRLPQTLAADNTYGNGELLQWLDERGIAPYIRVKENPAAKTDLYGIDRFTYVPEQNCYLCPEGKHLKYVGINKRNRTHLYYSTAKRCRDCSQKSAAREVSIGPSPSTPAKQRDSEPMPWPRHRRSRSRNGLDGKWKHCSQN